MREWSDCWDCSTRAIPSWSLYWYVAMVLPQVIATPAAGFLLDNFQRVGRTQNIPNLGYVVIFMVAVVYFIIGTVFVKQIKSVR